MSSTLLYFFLNVELYRTNSYRRQNNVDDVITINIVKTTDTQSTVDNGRLTMIQ